MSFTQVKLETKDHEQMTTWLDSDTRIKPGVIIELKKDNRMWKVLEVFSTVDNIPDHRSFDNNNYDKHTGLFK